MTACEAAHEARPFVVAHLTDPHLAPLPAPGLRALLSQRILGYLSWKLRRRHVHRQEVLAALVDDLHAQHPDHIAVTGDLVNISLPAEFVRAAAWLRELGDPEHVSAIPGNHDAYVRLPWETTIGLWADFMTSDTPDGGTARPAGAGDFPRLRQRDGVAIVLLSTAVRTPPGHASGRLGPDQMARLDTMLEETGRKGRFRLVLIHHPPLDATTTRRKRLVDSQAFRETIARTGCELVLHGHNHMHDVGEIAGADGPVPVLGLPSASSSGEGTRPPAHYALLAILKTSEGWRVDVRLRCYDPATGRFATGPATVLALARTKPARVTVCP